MQEIDFFHNRIDAMFNLNDPLAVLTTRLPWHQIEAAVSAKFEHQNRAAEILTHSGKCVPVSRRYLREMKDRLLIT